MTENKRKKFIREAVILILCLLLTSCKGIELENKTEQVEEYTKAQAMILIANERNRYENAYSGDLWSISSGDGDTTFDRLVIQNVKDFMETVKLLCMLAEERGVTASSSERELIRQMTDAYANGLSDGDYAYMGCTREDIQKVYTDYFTACKMAELLSESDIDISDSEVKVIRIMQIGTEDVKKAKAILKRLKIDGANFASMASRYTELPEIELSLSKSDGKSLIERTAFSLEEGQISNILCVDGMYYILRCTNGYDEAATRDRKKGIMTAVDSLHFYQVIEPYRNEHNIAFFDRFWSELSFTEPDGSEAENFFDIYNEFIKGGL